MIVVAGKNNIAVHALEVLVSKLGCDQLVAVPNTTDSGEDSWQRSFLKSARLLGVKIANLESLNNDDRVKCFISLECDKIIDPSKFPSNCIFNIHFSDLPKYKGMYTSFWPIYNGEKSSGVTLHRINKGIDTGEIISKIEFPISSKDRSLDLYSKYISNAKKLFNDHIEQLIEGNIQYSPQQAEGATYYSKKSLDYSNIEIDYFVTAWQLQRQVYAYSFRPYQLPLIHERFATEVEITSQQSLVKPGEILDRGDNFVVLSTIDYDVIVYFDKLESLLFNIPKISISDFKRSLKNIAGLNDRNNKGWSPIIVAAYNGRMDIVEYLLSEGANVNDFNYRGTSVLMYAKEYCLRSGSLTMFEFLIKNGADIDLVDYSGNKLIDYLNKDQQVFFRLS